MTRLHLMAIAIICLSVLCGGCSKGVFSFSEKDYKSRAVLITNSAEFSRNPDTYKGKKLMFVNPIANVKQNGQKVDLLYIPTDSADTPIIFHYTRKGKEELIKTHDVLRIWGEFQGVNSKKIVDFAPECSVIEIDAKYVSRPAWGSVLQTWLSGCVNNSSYMLELKSTNINTDNIEIEGVVGTYGSALKIIGTINDDGTGKFEYVDETGIQSGVGGTLKIVNEKKIEVDTPSAQQNVYSLLDKKKTIRVNSIEAGHYVFQH